MDKSCRPYTFILKNTEKAINWVVQVFKQQIGKEQNDKWWWWSAFFQFFAVLCWGVAEVVVVAFYLKLVKKMDCRIHICLFQIYSLICMISATNCNFPCSKSLVAVGTPTLCGTLCTSVCADRLLRKGWCSFSVCCSRGFVSIVLLSLLQHINW